MSFQQRFVENEFVDQRVAGEFHGPFEVLLNTLRVVVNGPTLLFAHPPIEPTSEPRFPVLLSHLIEIEKDRHFQREFQRFHKPLIGGLASDGGFSANDFREFVKEAD